MKRKRVQISEVEDGDEDEEITPLQKAPPTNTSSTSTWRPRSPQFKVARHHVAILKEENEEDIPLRPENQETPIAAQVKEHVPYHIYHVLKIYQGHMQNMSKMVDNPQFSDLKLEAGGKVISASRCVLAAQSDYFFHVLNKSKTNVLVLPPNVDYNTMKMAVQFMYTGVIKLTRESIESVTRLAQYLRADKLMQHCAFFIMKHIEPKCAVDDLLLAQELDMDTVADYCADFIAQNLPRVAGLPAFLNISFLKLKGLLDLDRFCVKSERDVIDGICVWLEAHRRTVAAKLFAEQRDQLLHSVRFTQLDWEYLVNVVEKLPILQGSAALPGLLSNTYRYMAAPADKKEMLGDARSQPRFRPKHIVKLAEGLLDNAMVTAPVKVETPIPPAALRINATPKVSAPGSPVASPMRVGDQSKTMQVVKRSWSSGTLAAQLNNPAGDSGTSGGAHVQAGGNVPLRNATMTPMLPSDEQGRPGHPQASVTPGGESMTGSIAHNPNSTPGNTPAATPGAIVTPVMTPIASVPEQFSQSGNPPNKKKGPSFKRKISIRTSPPDKGSGTGSANIYKC